LVSGLDPGSAWPQVPFQQKASAHPPWISTTVGLTPGLAAAAAASEWGDSVAGTAAPSSQRLLTALAARAMRPATAAGSDTWTAWLPGTSVTVDPERSDVAR